jgi:hypothetical protein
VLWFESLRETVDSESEAATGTVNSAQITGVVILWLDNDMGQVVESKCSMRIERVTVCVLSLFRRLWVSVI